MVYYSRWKSVELEVAHTVRTYHHRRFLLVEGIYYLLKRVRTRVEIVRIQLDSEASATGILHCHVPASAYSEVVLLRNDVDKSLILDVGKQFGSAVSGVIIYHYDIVREIRLLSEHAVDGICDSLHAIEDRDNDSGFHVKVLLLEVRFEEVGSIYRGFDGFQMRCCGAFHLYLHLSIARIDIVKLLLAALSRVFFLFGVEVFIEMHDRAVARKEETKVVETSVFVIAFRVVEIVIQQASADEDKLSEVEIIAYAAFLIVYCGVLFRLSFDDGVVVSVEHGAISVVSHACHAVEGKCAELDRRSLL